MLYKEVKLNGRIGNYIDCIWWETYCNERQDWNPHYVVPDNSIELIFTDSLFYRTTTTGQPVWGLKSHLAGLKTFPQICRVSKSPLISVRFKPQGLYLFSKIEVKNTINACFSPEACFGKGIKIIEDQLFAADSQAERIKLLTDFFNSKLSEVLNRVDAIFEEMINSIDHSLGMMPISDLCHLFDLSYKTIERKFVNSLGITPKKYCRLVRTINCLTEGRYLGDSDFTELAYRYSYFDQSHFIKDVKSLTNHSPRDFYKLKKGIQTLTFG